MAAAHEDSDRVSAPVDDGNDCFRQLLQDSPVPTYVVGRDPHHILAVNAAAADLYGYTEEELLSLHAAKLHAGLPSLFDTAPSNGEVHRQQRSDGRSITVRVDAHPVRYQEHEAMLVMARSVRSPADAPDHRAESRYKVLAEHASDLVMLHDASGDVTWASPSVSDMLGRTPDDLQETSFFSVVHADDEDDVRSYLRRVSSGAPSGPIQFRALRPDGSTIWLETLAEPVYDEDGTLTHVVSSSRDVTERMEAQTSLQREREFLQKLFDAIPVMLTVYNPDRNDIHVNREFERVLGWTKSDADEINLMKAVDPHPAYREEAVRFMDTPGSGWDDFVAHTKDGDKVYCSWSNIRLSDDTLVGIGIDLTERKQLEAQLRHAQKMETVGTLVGGIAHDFNNILHAAIVYLQMAVEELPDDSLPVEFLEETEDGLHTAADLVSNLLTFSRQEGKAVEMPVDLGEIVEESIDLVEPSMPPDVQMRTDIDADCVVAGDPSQLRQVAMNVMTNAAQAMEDHGPDEETVLDIDVRTTTVDRELADRYLHLTPGRYVCLSISDTGPGMDPGTRDRIFEPFFTTRDGGRGTGLGLSVVHGIVQAHNGEITVFTEPGEGTTFNLYFPPPNDDTSRDRASAATTDSLRAIEPGMSGHILFVDDDEQVIELERVRLQRLGYEVTTRQSAQAALDLLAEDADTYDLVLTDYAMPGRTGLDLARTIADNEYDLPVVLMSGFSAQVSEEEARRAGVVTFLRKPVGSSELEEVLAALL